MTRFSREYAAALVSKQRAAYAIDATKMRSDEPIIPRAKPQPKSEPIFPGLCIAAGYPRPETEFPFHPTRKWKFDFAWPEQKIAVEQEGAIWANGGGGHSHPLGIERDIEKYNAAALLGWRILRYAPENLALAIIDLRGIFK